MTRRSTPAPGARGRAAKLAVYAGGLLLFTATATVRFGDSAHAMGTLAEDGGRARHPVVLSAGHRRHTIVVTATVRPPLAGSFRVTVEGTPDLTTEIAQADSAASLGLHHRPRLNADTLVDVRPGDRLALWLVLRRDRAPTEANPPPARIVFSAAASGRPVLTIPVLFRTRGGT